MVAFVAIVNLLVTLLNFYLAWKLWKLRRAIAKATKALIAAERKTYNVLHRAPPFVLKGQQGTENLRQRYQYLQWQLRQVQQVLTLLLLLPNLGRGLSRSQFPGSLRTRRKNVELE
jgi:hypothetical protein